MTALELATKLRAEARSSGFGWLLDAILERLVLEHPELAPALAARPLWRTKREVLEDELDSRAA